MKIIGLSGRMRSGKTTVAEFLRDNDTGYIFGFSWCIKELVYDYFVNCTIGDLDKQDTKELLHDCGLKYRTILQRVGSYFRDMWPDIWVEKWKEKVLDGTGWPSRIVIVPDVRFPNEVKAIQDMGGIVIRLTRNPVNSDDETETALDGFVDGDNRVGEKYFDYVISNHALTINQTNEICLKTAKEYINEP